jgi:hypothetical protein
MDNREASRKTIRDLVWSGFYDAEEAYEVFLESMFGPDEIDVLWLRAEIEEEFRRKVAEEETWPETTDCDRLDEAFDELEADGILALHNAGYTQDNGIDDVTQFYHEAGGEDSSIVGYCFYHGQDLERVIERGDLELTFGDIEGDNARGVDVGRKIEQALRKVGLTVVWDGSVSSRILIRGIKWQRRSE